MTILCTCISYSDMLSILVAHDDMIIDNEKYYIMALTLQQLQLHSI